MFFRHTARTFGNSKERDKLRVHIGGEAGVHVGFKLDALQMTVRDNRQDAVLSLRFPLRPRSRLRPSRSAY